MFIIINKTLNEEFNCMIYNVSIYINKKRTKKDIGLAMDWKDVCHTSDLRIRRKTIISKSNSNGDLFYRRFAL